MASLSACVECLFAEYGPDYAARVRAAHAQGYAGVEFWEWRNKDLRAIDAALTETQTALVCISLNSLGPDPTSRGRFLEEVDEAAEVASRFGHPSLVVTGGKRIDGLSHDEHVTLMAEALRAAAELAARHTCVVVLEALNPVDLPTYWLTDTATAAAVVDAVASPNVRLLYDVRHSAAAGESPPDAIRAYGHLFGHVHIADYPGHHRPGTGAINWPATMGALRDTDYAGWVGMEYMPTAETAASLASLLGAPILEKRHGA
jgi:hydroxypyruvate isomerase